MKVQKLTFNAHQDGLGRDVLQGKNTFSILSVFYFVNTTELLLTDYIHVFPGADANFIPPGCMSGKMLHACWHEIFI